MPDLIRQGGLAECDASHQKDDGGIQRGVDGCDANAAMDAQLASNAAGMCCGIRPGATSMASRRMS